MWDTARLQVKLSVRPSGPGLYRLATICLAALCAVLLISIIAVAAHNKKTAAGGGEQSSAGTDPQVQRQRQDVANITALTAALSKLQQEKVELQRERDELLAKLNAKPATTAPEVIKPRTAATTTTTTTTAPPIVCPDDWHLFNSSCYFISRVSRDWMESQTFCQSKGGHLAIIHSAEEQTFLWELLPRGHWNAYWFGISDEHTEDEWKWVDGTPLVGGFWEEGEPNNHIDEDCGYIVKTRKLERVAVKSWYDAPCTMYWPFICEKEIGTAAANTTATAAAAAQ
ncbi:C-type lectin domain family 4 member M-like [Myripristis murdjan]|uniref:C-type lectin domain family 4 member M-like n=1 Tax=Myripristis murdjan TaxID=586833 RepID=A0A667XLB4_9TELE|nr:C-type lectin domain family 4 member M-like [Myripristis murdjan]